MDPLHFDDLQHDADEIERAIGLLFDPNAIVELRALNALRAGTVSGYFDGTHRREMARAAQEWSGKAPGVYATLNPVRTDLIARANNRAKPFAKDTTKDNEILRRIRLLLDFDPKRPSGISATDAEHQAALDRARECRDYLRGRGWPEAIYADSGNGAHLLYRIDLPNDPEGTDLVKRVLESLASRFSDAGVDVDRTVYNASRISKLYGTLAAKGDPTPERPHRIARILEAPERTTVVPADALKSLASRPTPSEPRGTTRDELFRELTTPGGNGFDLERWITEKGLPVVGQKPWNDGGDVWVLNPCPWNPDHTDSAAVVGRLANGAVFAKCHHNGCAGKSWHDLRDVYEPGWRAEHLIETPSQDGHGPGGSAGRAIEAVDDPDRLARLFIESNCQGPDGLTLRSYQDRWYRWDGVAYFEVPEGELNAELGPRIKSEFDRISIKKKKTARKVTQSLLGNIRLALKGKLLVPGSRDMPCWIGDGPWPVSEVLPARNGLFHLPSLAECLENHVPPSPHFFSTFALDYEIVTDPEPPAAWLAFLNQLWPDDPACIETLQEFMGYFLTQDTSQQKILLLIGPTRSGKGSIAKVMTGLVGARNVAGPTAGSLKTNFGLQELVGKPLAILSDAQLKRHDDALVERLKMISGEDLITVDKKYADPFTVKLPTRLVIMSNDLPRFKDTSGALANRMVILPLTVSFLGREDPTLGARLLEERPGILSWAVAGWKRLKERRRFVQPESGRALLEELQDLSSQVGQFVRECGQVGNPGAKTPREKLYAAYEKWCGQKGYDYPLSSNSFGAELRAVVPSLGDTHPVIAGERVRCYTGIALKA